MRSLLRVARSLSRSPGYLAAAVLTSALGIGALTAVVTLISKALLEPLPWPDADRLVVIQEKRGERTISVSWPNFLDYRARTRTLDGIAAFSSTSVNLTRDGNAERLIADMVTSNVFDVLGVRPLLGRTFVPAEDEPGSASVVVMGHAIWATRFGADSSIVGRTIDLSGERFEVIGVMPPGFRFADGVVYGPADFWLPMSRLPARSREARGEHPGLVAIGRLRAGQTIEAARAEIVGIAQDLTREYPNTNGNQSARIDDMQSIILGGVRGGLLLMFGAVTLLLLITCANVAGLALARTVARGREMGVRLALGANHRRLGLELVTENLVIGTLGGLVGLLLGVATLQWLNAYVADLPRLGSVTLDWRVFGFIAGASLLASLLSAIAPLLWTRRIDAERWLRSRGTDSAGTRTRRVFVTVQVALSIVLLTVGGLLMRSFVAMRGTTGGIDAEGVLTFTVSLPEVPYADSGRTPAYFQQLEYRLRAIPGVEAVGAVSILPFSGFGAQSGIARIEDARVPQSERSTDVMVATPDYFTTMGISLVRGRMILPTDASTSNPVAVVDERFAASFWPGEDPIGRRVQGWGFESIEVVGVVRHVTNYGVALPSREELYVPYLSRPFRQMNVVMKARGNLTTLVNPVRAAVRALDANVPAYRIRLMEEVVDATISNQRLLAFVSAAFATTALLLTAIGLYALIAFQVALRTREIGVRMALGAQRTAVIAGVVRQAVGLVMGGSVLGAFAAAAAIGLIRNQLFGVGVADPVVIGGVATMLVLVAISASALPARRAAGISPQIAMRDE